MPPLLRRLLHALLTPADVPLGAGAGPARVQRGERGLILSDVRVRGRVPPGPPIQEAVRCSLDGAQLEGVELVGLCALCSLAEAELRQPLAAEGAAARACRLDGARLHQPALRELEASGCTMRGLQVQGGELPAMTACDLIGARLRGVRLRQALGCDLSLARLEDCDLRGADLRGSRLRGADLRGTLLGGAQVQDADFTGARGLDAPTRAELLAGGARLRGAPWLGLARRLWPGASPEQQHRRAAAAEWTSLALLGGILLAATLLALRPPPPPAAPPLPPALARPPTAAERQQAQEALRTLRAALARARDLRAQRGAQQALWPTLVELQDNRFDIDGEGPSEVQEALVPGGLPDNPLTGTRGGALVYCEEAAQQPALAEVDTDWYYCEHTGRLFAAAGASGEATLNW